MTTGRWNVPDVESTLAQKLDLKHWQKRLTKNNIDFLSINLYNKYIVIKDEGYYNDKVPKL